MDAALKSIQEAYVGMVTEAYVSPTDIRHFPNSNKHERNYAFDLESIMKKSGYKDEVNFAKKLSDKHFVFHSNEGGTHTIGQFKKSGDNWDYAGNPKDFDNRDDAMDYLQKIADKHTSDSK